MRDEEIIDKVVNKLKQTTCPPALIGMLKNIAQQIRDNRGDDSFEYDPAWDLRIIFFDHLFAKHFWGDGYIIGSHVTLDGSDPDLDKLLEELPRAWQKHIQQLALAEDRLQYISQFI